MVKYTYISLNYILWGNKMFELLRIPITLGLAAIFLAKYIVEAENKKIIKKGLSEFTEEEKKQKIKKIRKNAIIDTCLAIVFFYLFNSNII